MKIRFVMFALAKYGGIIPHIEAKYQAMKELGHDVDIIILDYVDNLSLKNYQKKINDLETGEFQKKVEENIKSQNGGYEKSKITGLWFNTYYGWLLEPFKNRIPVFNENGLEMWYDAIKDVDIILWSFIPTKTSEAKGFNWWDMYFDLPEKIKQVVTVHDAYYSKRNQWTNVLKNKIEFLETVSVTNFFETAPFDLPRFLNLESRLIPKNLKNFFLPKKEREFDFFAAHIFKSMKRIEDFVGSAPYVDGELFVAGSGIELYYMMTDDEKKQKAKYTVSKKIDPDADEKDLGKSLWKRAEENEMYYLGLIPNSEVNEILKNTKFAIDLSYSSQYAKFINVHLNGFIIEAMINGAVPVLRNYNDKNPKSDDFIFNNIEAIWIPTNATFKEIGDILNEAKKMPEKRFKKMVESNFKFCENHLNIRKNSKKLLNAIKNPKDLPINGNDKNLRKKAVETLENFFGYDNFPDWFYLPK